MKKNEVLNFLRDMSNNPNVRLIYLFGSVVNLDDNNIIPPESDVDVAVFFRNENEILSVMGQLQLLLEKLPIKYDLVALNFVHPSLQNEILKGQCIYADDEKFREQTEKLIHQNWQDLRYKYEYEKQQKFQALLRRYGGGERTSEESIDQIR